MSESRTVPVVIANADLTPFLWLLAASAVCLALAFFFRRNLWARWALLTLAALCSVGAWVL